MNLLLAKETVEKKFKTTRYYMQIIHVLFVPIINKYIYHRFEWPRKKIYLFIFISRLGDILDRGLLSLGKEATVIFVTSVKSDRFLIGLIFYKDASNICMHVWRFFFHINETKTYFGRRSGNMSLLFNTLIDHPVSNKPDCFDSILETRINTKKNISFEEVFQVRAPCIRDLTFPEL